MKRLIPLFFVVLLSCSFASSLPVKKGISTIYKNSNILYLWCQGSCSFYLCNYSLKTNSWVCPQKIKISAIINGKKGYLVFVKTNGNNYEAEIETGSKAKVICPVQKVSEDSAPFITISTNTLTITGCTVEEEVKNPSGSTKETYQYTYKEINETTLAKENTSILLLEQPLPCGEIIYNYTTRLTIEKITPKKEKIMIMPNGTRKIVETTTEKSKNKTFEKVLNNTLIIVGQNEKSVLYCCKKKTNLNKNEKITIKFKNNESMLTLSVGSLKNTTIGETKENKKINIITTNVGIVPDNGIIDYKIGNSSVYVHVRINKNKKETYYNISFNEIKNNCSFSGAKEPKINHTNKIVIKDQIEITNLDFPLDFGDIIYNYTEDLTKGTVLNNTVWYVPNSECKSLDSCGKNDMKTCKPIELVNYTKKGINKFAINIIKTDKGIEKITIPNTIYGTITFDFENNKVFNLEVDDSCTTKIGKKKIIINSNFGSAISSVLKHGVFDIVFDGHKFEYDKSSKTLTITNEGTPANFNPTIDKIKPTTINDLSLGYGFDQSKGFYYIYFNDSNGNIVFGIEISETSITIVYQNKKYPDKDLPIYFESANGNVKVFLKNGKVYFIDGTHNTPVNGFCDWVNKHSLYVLNVNGHYYFAIDVTNADFLSALNPKKVVSECGRTLFIADQIVYTQIVHDKVISNVVKVSALNPDTLSATLSNYDPSKVKISLNTVQGCPNLYEVPKNSVELTCDDNKYTINIDGKSYKVQGIGTISTINGETVAVKNIIADLGENYAKGVNINVKNGTISIGSVSGALLGPSRAGGLPIASSGPVKFPYTDQYYYLLGLFLVILMLYKSSNTTRRH